MRLPLAKPCKILAGVSPDWCTAATCCCFPDLLVQAKPHLRKDSALDSALPSLLSRRRLPSPASLMDDSRTELPHIWCMWMPIVWVVRLMPPVRMPSLGCLTSLSLWVLMRSLKTLARTRWCSWSGASRWPPHWLRNDWKFISIGLSTKLPSCRMT
ncbi:hypothetical protein Bbr_1126 [Bifidobacterium breve UCC2003]|nr:hypothetical protein Bbr_1126 [Bifidobacterium breve UCC2003]